jgi:hypothetical protein
VDVDPTWPLAEMTGAKVVVEACEVVSFAEMRLGMRLARPGQKKRH